MKRPQRLLPAWPAFLLATQLFFLPGEANCLQVHQQIQGPLASPRAVTAKCLECHRQQGEAVLQTSHWTWTRQRTVDGKVVSAGKKDSLAGFAIDATGNGPRCLRCHISVEPSRGSLSAPAAEEVDCLACHDTTGRYRHLPAAGQDRETDLVAVARLVGRPTPRNCMGCHFADCGLTPTGPGTDKSAAAGTNSDVHLANAGFSCLTCHQVSGHVIRRQVDGGCGACHAEPHAMATLNVHSRTIACQSCHIPAFAQDAPALIAWNWLLTGKTNTVFRAGSGSGLQLHDQNGFWSAGDIEPVHLWDDATDQVYSRGQKIQPQELTVLQQPGPRSNASKLAPFRVLYATQLYDSKYRYLISPLLQPDGEVLFPDTGWDAIARRGMEALVLPYSGQFSFTATATYRRLNHGVAPAAQALDCLDCHGGAGRIRWQQLGFAGDPMAATTVTPIQAAPESPGAGQEAPSAAEPIPALPPSLEPAVPARPLP